jgi:alkyldihydroxyacetonephosphate synthase
MFPVASAPAAGPPGVRFDANVRERAARRRDLWPRTLLGLAAGTPLPEAPDGVVWPEDPEQVAACLAWAEARGLRVAPWGAGSGVCGALQGESGVLSLDTKRMARIGAVDRERRVVRVGPGVIGQHLEDALARQGWCTRHSPSSIGCSTVGGWAATRSSGQFSSRYGSFADMVEGMRVASPLGAFGTGTLRRADDVVGSEDLHAWVLGGEGRFGVITDLEVRVHPLPAARRLRGWRFGSVEDALVAVRTLLQADLLPAVVRLYDPVDTRIAGKGSATRAEGARWLAQLAAAVDAIPGVRARSLALPLALPRLLNALARGIASGCVLISGWEGEPADVEARAAVGEAMLRSGGGLDLGEGPGEHWYAHRHDVSYKLAPVVERGGFADTMEVAAIWSRLPALYDAVRDALTPHALVMAHFSHAWREGCSIYFTFAGVGDVAVYDAAWGAALAAAAGAGGTVAHHHGVGRLKAEAAARELAAALPTLRAHAARLDPRGVLAAPPLPDATPSTVDAPGDPVLDVVSRIATLPAGQPAEERDAWLAASGWRLLHGCAGPLATHHPRKVEPPASAILGGVVRTPHGLARIVDAPRSGAGPDPRAGLPADAWVSMTVPVTPLAGAS